MVLSDYVYIIRITDPLAYEENKQANIKYYFRDCVIHINVLSARSK